MTHLKVAVRVRPLSRRETIDNPEPILKVENGNTIAVTNIKVPEQNAGDSRERIRRFTFDFCFNENSTQDDVFEAVESVIAKAIKSRYHSCVLAYGQSSSGKTHTMMGFPHDPGLTPRLCQRVFGYLNETAVGEEMLDAKITVSYLEIYNEKVRDLLPRNLSEKIRNSSTLKIRQHPKKGPYVQGLTEHCVCDSATLLQILQEGSSNRRVAATLTNAHSSRSHSVFIVTFCGVKLTLVDLAGSERAGNRCYGTSRFREGANINKSLVALGNVISALAEETSKYSKGIRRRFIPYRDSVLTWLLKDTLGGNSDTVMIATISPSSTCYSETVNTLRFGQRAKLIVSIPVVNEDPREKTIRELRTEIVRLRELLKLGKIIEIQHTDGLIPMSAEGKTEDGSCPQQNDQDSDSNHKTTEKLIPVMTFSSRINEDKKPPARLRRTYSVDHSLKMQNPRPKKFGSDETISTVKKPPLPSTLRKRSIDKSILSLQKTPQETKQTETSKPFSNVGAKVNSIRKSPVKPRSQIVAAVTSRLYGNTKKKEASTDTSDIPTVIEVPKELTICSNARLKLKELTRKALKAHRSKNEETQTDLFPVMRVKETSTDVDDLKLVSQEVKSVETSTEQLTTEDKEINCSFNLKNALVITRSCGTQFSEKPNNPNNVSFTKYLRDLREPSKIDFFNPHTANPIYTSSVNINISHNYINGGQRVPDNVSDDSLDDQNNVCFPTPDLISNHNSLEPHAHATSDENLESKIQLGNYINENQHLEDTGELILNKPEYCVANCQVIPDREEQLISLDIPCVCAPEICVVQTDADSCQHFVTTTPEVAKPNIIESKTYSDDCITVTEPLVLKSIMKHMPGCDDESPIPSETELPDSLEYHMINNKKVRFGKKKSLNDRMFKAMSEFLEEATVLMNNLAMAAKQVEHDYELQVTINDISGQRKRKRKRKSEERVNVKSQTDDRVSEFVQTYQPVTVDTSTQITDFDIPVNKYEALLEDSCRRLERKINHNDDRLHQAFSYNPWDLSAYDNEDTSLESNPVTFSDYGSLPRRKHHSTPSCSPSALLRQLTSIRKQVVETSREELFNNGSESSVL